MSAWRRKALDVLPEQRRLIEAAESPMALWIELHLVFRETVKSGDASGTRAILEFASWCVSSESGPLPNDTSTAAAVAFYEHLGEEKAFWPKFREWFQPREFEALKGLFHYLLSEDEFKQLEGTFRERRGYA